MQLSHPGMTSLPKGGQLILMVHKDVTTGAEGNYHRLPPDRLAIMEATKSSKIKSCCRKPGRF